MPHERHALDQRRPGCGPCGRATRASRAPRRRAGRAGGRRSAAAAPLRRREAGWVSERTAPSRPLRASSPPARAAGRSPRATAAARPAPAGTGRGTRGLTAAPSAGTVTGRAATMSAAPADRVAVILGGRRHAASQVDSDRLRPAATRTRARRARPSAPPAGRAAPRRPRRPRSRRSRRRRATPRDGEREALVGERRGHERRQDEPEAHAQHGADQRGDDALVAHHPADLPARHADRAQRAELPRPLERRQHERVDDPEQGDDHGQRQQHVEDGQELVHASRAARPRTPRSCGSSMSGLPASAADRVGVRRTCENARSLRERGRVGLRADRHRAEAHDVDHRRVLDAAHRQVELVARRRGERERVADAQALLLRPALVDHGAVRSERARDVVVALHPVEAVAVAVDGVDRLLLAEGEGAVLLDRRHADAGVRRSPRARPGSVGDQPSAPVTT